MHNHKSIFVYERECECEGSEDGGGGGGGEDESGEGESRLLCVGLLLFCILLLSLGCGGWSVDVFVRMYGRAYVWSGSTFDGCVRRLVCDVRAFGVRAFGVWCSMFVRSTFVMFDVRCSMFDVTVRECAYICEEC